MAGQRLEKLALGFALPSGGLEASRLWETFGPPTPWNPKGGLTHQGKIKIRSLGEIFNAAQKGEFKDRTAFMRAAVFGPGEVKRSLAERQESEIKAKQGGGLLKKKIRKSLFKTEYPK